MSKHKVLITLDDSTLSQQIVPAVKKLFSPQDTALLLFSVVTPHLAPELRMPHSAPSAGDVMTTVVLHVEQNYQREMEAQTERYHEIGQALAAQRARDLQALGVLLEQAGYSVFTDAWTGEPAETIVAFAQAKKVDLIAMATHGRSGINRLLMGSVAEEVVRTSPIPVLLIRPDGA